VISVATDLSEQEAFSHALAALQSRKFDDAARLFDAVLQAQPKHIAALNLLGITHTQPGRFADAEIYLKRALQEQPKSDATLYNYGLVLKALHRAAEALQRFSEALALNPGAAETWNNRGTAFNNLKRYSEAIDDFDKSVALQPRSAEALRNPVLLAATKAKLAGDRESCPLFDTQRFTRHIECAYREMAGESGGAAACEFCGRQRPMTFDEYSHGQ
jgi:tetratricopeptide (TPR) repeat protein